MAIRCGLDLSHPRPNQVVHGHHEVQDEACEPWKELLTLIAYAERNGATEFAPFSYMTQEERDQIVTLPKELTKLTRLTSLELYGTSLVRIPPFIDQLINLEKFTPYTSYHLHYLPYEITRLPKLKKSCISTRALYGNEKTRGVFPDLKADPYPFSQDECSVCKTAVGFDHLTQYWVTLKVATDVVPLLVHTCSTACLNRLPASPEDYVQGYHQGGCQVVQPKASYGDDPDDS